MKLTGQNQCPLIVISPIEKKFNPAIFTNGNDAANKSYVDGVKQAATSVFAPLYFFNCEMGHDNKKTTEFLKS